MSLKCGWTGWLAIAMGGIFWIQQGAAVTLAQDNAATSNLRIVVLEGEGAFNSIHDSTPQTISVRVEDGAQRPVSGASVTFQLPANGPSGSFRDESRIAMRTSDLKGEAIISGIEPNDVQGEFQIRVTASYQGKTANAVINQTNVMSLESGGSGVSHKKLWLILAAAGGAAVAGALASGGGHSSTLASSAPAPGASTPQPAGISLSPGTPVVTGPR